MLHRVSRNRSRALTGAGSVRSRIASLAWACREAFERLEERCLFSVAASVLAGPVDIAGNTWTYQLDSPTEGTLGFETLTSKGLTTHNGQPAIEVDGTIVKANSDLVATEKIFYAFQGGAFVILEEQLTSATGNLQVDTYAPAEWVVPAALTANVPVTSPTSTDTTVSTPSGGSPTTTTDTVTTTVTLVSETPSVTVQVPANAFTCYQVNTSQTTTDSQQESSTDLSQTFVDPSIGIVEIDDLINGNTLKLTQFTGTSFHLAITGAPTSTLANDKIDPAVQISIKDSSNATDTDPADAVTITVSIGPGSTGAGTLKGQTTVRTAAGVANFSNLSIDKPGNYVLLFTDSKGRSILSNSFDIKLGKLVFKPVKNGIAGSVLSPAVEVELVNNKNQVIKDSPSLVTLNITGSNSSNPMSGNTAQLVNGIAVFSGFKLGAPGTYTLSASDAQNDIVGLSNQFEITGVHLAFRKQPAKVGANAPLSYVVVLEDSRNRLVNNSSIGLGLALNVVSGGQNATLAHPADTVDFGVASNTGGDPASINVPGTYTITFSVISESSPAFDYTIDPITSDQFDVVANHLVFVKQPKSTGTGIALRYEVDVKDYRNQTVTTNADQIHFTLIIVSGGSGAVLASNVDTLLAGVAINANNLISINAPGTYRLSVTDVPANPGNPLVQGGLSDTFKIKGTVI